MAAAMATGCASHKAYVLARRDPQYSPNPTNRIALVNHLKPRPEEQMLCIALTAELKQQGFHLVPQEEADYTLTYWIEDNWRPRKTPVQTYDPFGYDPRFGGGSMPTPQFFPGGATIYPIPLNTPPRTEIMIDDPVSVQGIRLQLYSRASAQGGRPYTAWEGYIDAGFKVRPEREPVLLRTLLTYFGKDYAGRAKFVE